MWFQLVGAVLQVAITCVAARAVGGRLLSSRWDFCQPALRLASEAGLGLLLFSHLIFALSLLGWATRTSLRVLFFLMVGIAVFELIRRAKGAPAQFRLPAGQSAQSRSAAAGLWFLVLGLLYVFWMVLGATLPPLGMDEIVYHLAVPKRILEGGGSQVFLDNIYAYFPQCGEMLFLLGLSWGGEIAAKLFHVAFGLILGFALYGFCRRQLSRNFALAAAALFFSTPSVMVVLPWAYVDLVFAAFSFLALVAVLEFVDTRQLNWAVLAGIFGGAALSTKYTGLQFLFLLLVVVLLEHLLSRRKEFPVAAIVLAGVSLAVAAPYFGRNWWVTGWPLFPFDLGLFRLNPEINWDSNRASLFLFWLSGFGSSTWGSSLRDILVAPVLVFFRAEFNNPQLYDGVIGPVFLLIPLLLARLETPRQVRLLAGFSLLFLFYWAFTIRQVRFLLPLLPVLCFLLAFGLSHLRSRTVIAIVILLGAYNVAAGVKKSWDLKPLAFWLGKESREEYLSARLIGYPLYEAANGLLRAEDQVYLVNMRNFGYYLNSRWRSDFIFEHYQTERVLSLPSPEIELARFFSGRKITHLMIDEGITFSHFGLAPDQRQQLRSFLDHHGTVLARHGQQALYRLAPANPSRTAK